MVGGQAAFLIIDDTAQPKKGKHSVGVAPQYATTLGKNANCQTLVSITLARDEVPVMVADGAPQRIGSMGQQHLPGEEAWLIGEHRSTGERKYYPSNLPADTPLKHLAGAVKARWACEQAHQQLKEELGLDHFEGRSWGGLHRHALMTMIAYAFLQNRRLRQASGGKKIPRPATAAQPAGDPAGHLGSDLHAADTQMSTLQGAPQA